MRALDKLEDKVIEVIKKCEGKQVILYGYGKSGRFMEWFLDRVYHKQFCAVIDDSLVLYGKSIHRRVILEYVDSRETMILASFRKERMTEEMMSALQSFGYVEGENLLFLKEEIAPTELTFYGWLEHEYGIDLAGRIDTKDFDYKSQDATASGASRQMSLYDLCTVPGVIQQPVLDYGCGKGAAMVIMRAAAITDVDGIEKSESISNRAKANLKVLGETEMKVITGDAAEFEYIDRYNTFYFYDPFRGETFRKVIDNIENSVRRKNRIVKIVYANPWMHKEVERNGIFRLTKQFESSFFLNIVNVYENT